MGFPSDTALTSNKNTRLIVSFGILEGILWVVSLKKPNIIP